MNKISILENPVQEYAWGSKTAIQALLGESDSLKRPMAELWMGAHPKAPSKVSVDGKWEFLPEVIEKNPESILGKRVAENFSNKLPFLFKVLAADTPLSIQVHPDIMQARAGFARDNRLGIELNAPHRNYKDENHKPEILCALTPFQVLKGFREIEEILGLAYKITSSILADELALFRKRPDTHGLKRFFTALMTMSKAQQKLVVNESARLAKKLADKDEMFDWVVRLDQEYPGDIGVLSPVILNLTQLGPGEAIYLPAGELHSYLRGVGIELMSNSDNVLRGGLTPKHVDVVELLKIVKFETSKTDPIKPVVCGNCEQIYPTPADEFQLSVLSVEKGSSFLSPRNRGVEILICLKGEVFIKEMESSELLALTKGMSVIVPSAVSSYRIEGNATIYKASVPNPPVSSAGPS